MTSLALPGRTSVDVIIDWRMLQEGPATPVGAPQGHRPENPRTNPHTTAKQRSPPPRKRTAFFLSSTGSPSLLVPVRFFHHTVERPGIAPLDPYPQDLAEIFGCSPGEHHLVR